MFKAVMKGDEGVGATFIFGLSKMNLKMLRKDKPIMINCKDLGLEYEGTILIFFHRKGMIPKKPNKHHFIGLTRRTLEEMGKKDTMFTIEDVEALKGVSEIIILSGDTEAGMKKRFEEEGLINEHTKDLSVH